MKISEIPTRNPLLPRDQPIKTPETRTPIFPKPTTPRPKPTPSPRPKP